MRDLGLLPSNTASQIGSEPTLMTKDDVLFGTRVIGGIYLCRHNAAPFEISSDCQRSHWERRSNAPSLRATCAGKYSKFGNGSLWKTERCGVEDNVTLLNPSAALCYQSDKFSLKNRQQNSLSPRGRTWVVNAAF